MQSVQSAGKREPVLSAGEREPVLGAGKREPVLSAGKKDCKGESRLVSFLLLIGLNSARLS